MFALGPNDLGGTILDCSAGVAGFVAEAARKGARAIAVDPAYALPRDDLSRLGSADLLRAPVVWDDYPDRFTFAWYGSPDRRLSLRSRALAQFLLDLATHPARYVAGQIPQLPFHDGTFDVALCSHLLFTWADQLGLEWHRAA